VPTSPRRLYAFRKKGADCVVPFAVQQHSSMAAIRELIAQIELSGGAAGGRA